MKINLQLIAVALLFLPACATGRARFLIGTGIGAGMGATGGALFSPNEESTNLNALVFGLTGALLGGVTALLTDSKPEIPKATSDLRAAEQNTILQKEYPLMNQQELPEFLRGRLQPVVIEEFMESDTVSEDGTLHEPHKVYRIKKPGELFAKPAQKGVQNAGD